MKKKTISDILFKKKVIQVLLSICEKGFSYPLKIANDTKITYSHILKILNDFRELKLVEFRKEGRKKMVILTNKGKEICELVKKIIYS